MKIAITGATGFIGGRLCEYLREQGHQVETINRQILGDKEALQTMIAQCDAVINLAGAPIGRRWSDEYKQQLHDSRIVTTQRVVEAINNSQRCKLLISTSAIGYYPSTGCHNEYSPQSGDDFLANLCIQWEQQAQMVKPSVRLVIARLGVVLATDGGALKKLMMTQRFGIITIPGNGKYPFSWVDRQDVLRAMGFMVENKLVEGIFNFTVPESLTLRQFMMRFAEQNRNCLVISIPEFILRIAYTKAADFFLKGQCVYPQKLLDSGFLFRSPNLAKFIENCKRDKLK